LTDRYEHQIEDTRMILEIEGRLGGHTYSILYFEAFLQINLLIRLIKGYEDKCPPFQYENPTLLSQKYLLTDSIDSRLLVV
jgi:hypothetical protein